DDTSAILNTLDEQAVLMPAGMKPIIGKENIKQFWWPNDGSRTKVTEYTMKVMEIDGNNDLAYTRGRAELTFTYEKDEEKTEQTNSTMSLTLYRRDPEKG
ncbi:MAG: hypothetical protein GWN62_18880, partial [Aliifodinibius sp.]|nr:hypothetical protein [Nitrosopumilaceae archaeon]NIV13267.1 hypothetical protein [Fodinibius sp.]NIX61757.1 hypothetical protein [Nitrosopumilaceae archaeon]